MPAADLPGLDVAKQLAEVGDMLVAAFSDLKSTFQDLAAPLIQFVSAFNPGVVMLFNQAMKDLSATVGQILVPALETLRQIVGGVADFIFNIPTPIKKLIGDVVTAATRLAAFAASVAAVGAVLTQLLNPLAWAATATAALIPIVSDLIGGMSFFSDVADAVGVTLSSIGEAAKEVGSALLAAVGIDVVGGWKMLKDLIHEVADTALKLILVVGELSRQLAKGGLDVEKAWNIAGKQLDLIRAKQRASAVGIGAGSSSWSGLEDVSKRISAAAMASGAAANMGNAPKNDKEKALEAEIEKMRAGGPGDNGLQRMGDIMKDSFARGFKESLGWLEGAVAEVAQSLHINLKRPPGQG